MARILIIGNGIAGITAARHIRKRSDDNIVVISEESEYFYSRTALMYIFMGHMQFAHTKPYEDWFWEKNRIDLVHARVTQIELDHHRLQLDSGESLNYDKLILALGSRSNMFGWPGQELIGVQGLYHLQDLELLEQNTRGIARAVVVGGGLIGIELAEMLHSRNIPVTFLVREKHFWDMVLPEEEARLVEYQIRSNGIDLRLECELAEIRGTDQGRVNSLITKNGEVIPCEFVGITAGVSPNIALVENSSLDTDRGILVNEYLETNVPNVFAIGDCAQIRQPQPNRRPIEAVWYTGRIMGETVARTITGDPTPYDPGVWFNSAKFFDLEYQTYGSVPPTPDHQTRTFYWESGNDKAIRLNFHDRTHAIHGMNAFGIRIRHDVIDKWIREGVTIDFVLEHLGDINFDPELGRRYETDIVEKFNAENDTSLQPAPKSWRRILQRIGN